MQQQYFNSLIKVLTSIPFILAYCKDTLLAECSWLFVFESSAAPVVSESVSEDVVLVRSVDVTVRCHAGMLGGAAGVEPTMGEGNCFLQKKNYNKLQSRSHCEVVVPRISSEELWGQLM